MTTSTLHPRERLISTAARLVHKQGWTATGINQILGEAEIPKGSFYYYFRSKEALGVAVLQTHLARLKDLLSRTLLDDSIDAAAAIETFFSGLDAWLLEQGYGYGWPVASFADEVAATAPPLAAEARAAFAALEGAWAKLLRRCGSEAADVEDTARMIGIVLKGMFLEMKLNPDAPALEAARAVIQRMALGLTAQESARLKAVALSSSEAAPLRSLAS